MRGIVLGSLSVALCGGLLLWTGNIVNGMLYGTMGLGLFYGVMMIIEGFNRE